MACTTTFQINLKDAGDMPLDMAIYSSSQACFYGVRGQYVYKLNATTGVKESEFRFVNDVIFSESYIVELGGFLYIGTWRAGFEVAGQYAAGVDIFKIDYALSSSTPLGLNGTSPFTSPNPPFEDFGFEGFSNLVTDGTYIYGYYGVDAENVFKLDPTNIGGAVKDSFGVGNNQGVNDMAIDAVNGVLWIPGGENQEIWNKETGNITTGEEAHTTGSIDTMLGLCVVPNASPTSVKIYCVTGGQDIIKPNMATAYGSLPSLVNFGFSTLSILAGDAKPMRIRYNPNNGLVYIPTWSHDTVEIMDPATDTITAIKTGFTSPHDVVFSPTKAFAVQNSSIGLKEIT